jgi:hypothetical protein
MGLQIYEMILSARTVDARVEHPLLDGNLSSVVNRVPMAVGVATSL